MFSFQAHMIHLWDVIFLAGKSRFPPQGSRSKDDNKSGFAGMKRESWMNHHSVCCFWQKLPQKSGQTPVMVDQVILSHGLWEWINLSWLYCVATRNVSFLLRVWSQLNLHISLVHTHRIHGTLYIYLHGWLIFMVNVGKYTNPMDPMGYLWHLMTI